MSRPLLLVANGDPHHVGGHFLSAAGALGIPTHLCDTREAYEGPAWRRRMNWWTRGHRPSRLREFGDAVVHRAKQLQPSCVLATGIAPLDRHALKQIRGLGIRRVNYLTDDPWNPAHRAPWFMDALAAYDVVFSPRRANLSDLQRLGLQAAYLPFAYSPSVHFPEPPATHEERVQYDADVMFAGGADDERVQAMVPFLNAGLHVALYGGYWDRYRETRAQACGHLSMDELRRAVGGAKVCLGLVRHANRDHHSMRSYEVPAMGGCMLAQDTPDHRALFGDEGKAVVYFTSAAEAIDKARGLIGDPATRRRLAAEAHRVVTAGRHTYSDRLDSILARDGRR